MGYVPATLLSTEVRGRENPVRMTLSPPVPRNRARAMEQKMQGDYKDLFTAIETRSGRSAGDDSRRLGCPPARRRRANSTAWRCSHTPPVGCTWDTSVTIRSAMPWRAVQADAWLSRFCIRWAGTRSACRRRTPPSSMALTRPAGRTRTSETMNAQLQSDSGSPTTGIAQIAAHRPEYYRWNQWFFLRMLEKDLAYRSWQPR